MNTYSALNKMMAVLALIGLVMAAYLFWARPYQLDWGATDAEVQRGMPGDELNLHPTFLATRAITINGTPKEIWPWLIQMGYGRAGFYGYDILENLGSKQGIRSADRVLPEFQHFTVGDEVPISAVAAMRFDAIAPDHYLIWAGETGAVLVPSPGRSIHSMRVTPGWSAAFAGATIGRNRARLPSTCSPSLPTTLPFARFWTV